MTSPFSGPRVKVRRAKQHIHSFEVEQANLIRDPLFTVTIKPNHVATNMVDYVATMLRPMPEELAAIAGDAIHNLRSALDLLAGDLVRINGQSAKGVHFPFARDAAGLEEQIKNKKVYLAAPDVVDMIRALAPYKAGNHALRALHDLDLVDKHQLLLPVIQGASLPDLELNFVNDVYFRRPPNVPTLIDVGPNGYLFSAKAGEGIGDQRKMIGASIGALPEVLFGPETPFPKSRVLPTLNQLADLTEGIVEAFAAHCL